MSRGVNKVILVGHVGNPPESKQLPGGGTVCNLSLATSESWRDKSTGQQQERTEWHRLVAFGKTAEILAVHCQKGAQLYVEGSLRTRMWESDGKKMYTTEIVIDEFQFLGAKPEGGQAPRPANQSPMQSSPAPFDDFDGDSLPF